MFVFLGLCSLTHCAYNSNTSFWLTVTLIILSGSLCLIIMALYFFEKSLCYYHSFLQPEIMLSVFSLSLVCWICLGSLYQIILLSPSILGNKFLLGMLL